MEIIEFTCPFYLQSWHRMIHNHSTGNTKEETAKLFIEFAKKYTILSCSWLQVLKLKRKDLLWFYSREVDKNIQWTGYESHLYLLEYPGITSKSKIAEEGLSFPHKYLKQIFLHYQSHGDKPVSARMLQQVGTQKQLFKKMKENRQNINLWLDCLKEIENEESILANLELLLWRYPDSKKAWNAYISYLTQLNLMQILKIYQQCIQLYKNSRGNFWNMDLPRIFMTEKETVELYCNEIKDFVLRNESTAKWWINILKKELNFDILKAASSSYLERPLKNEIKNLEKRELQKVNFYAKKMKRCEYPAKEEKLQPILKKAIIYFDDRPQIQKFCFQHTFIRYLLKAANAIILRKLYAACKFLFSLQKTPLCYKLHVYPQYLKTYFCEESLYLSENDSNFHGLKNLHIYDKLYCQILENRNLLSAIIPILHCCAVRHINIKSQDLTVTEFKFLLSDRCYSASFLDVNIRDNNVTADNEKILQCFKSCSNLKNFKFVNNQHLICCGSKNLTDITDEMMVHISFFNFKTIYMKNGKCTKSIFNELLHYSSRLKSIKLENTVITDEYGREISVKEIEELVQHFKECHANKLIV